MQQLLVSEAMDPTVLKLRSSLSVVETGLALTRQQTHSAVVLDDADRLVGIVTLQDVNRAIDQWEQQPPSPPETYTPDGASKPPALRPQTLDEICSKTLLYAYRDETLSEAQARMAARGLRQLPVIDRANPQQILGLLNQEQITLMGKIAMTRNALKPHMPLPEGAMLAPVQVAVPALVPPMTDALTVPLGDAVGSLPAEVPVNP
jgi:CBS domain-containing protein